MSYDEDTSRITKLHDTIGELRAEIERLTHSLNVIRKRSAPTTHSWQSAQDAFVDIHTEARKALEGK